MKYLITGGCGFLGSNIAGKLLDEGGKAILFDNLYRFGSEKNLLRLKNKYTFKFVHGDIRNQGDIEKIITTEKPDVIYHLAGQVAMTTSIENPRMDFEVNTSGSINLLEAVRKYSPGSVIVYSSTNKVYGDIEWAKYMENETRFVCPDYPRGFPENIPIDFHSPYGNSKGSADLYMLDYARIFGLKTVVFRHSSMYGHHQFSTFDQAWIGWFCQKALEQKNDLSNAPFTISGNGKQVRDLLYVDDAVDLYTNSVKFIDKIKGNAFNIGGGFDNTLSLLELFNILENELDIKLKYVKQPFRISDQKVFIADISEIKEKTGWFPKVDKISGIRKMLKWLNTL